MEETSARPPGDGPLTGLRVLDLGQLLAAPFSAALLADYGADVVKVERPGVGDPLRELGAKRNGYSLWWKANARNKKSISLDLKSEDGVATFLELVRVADVVVENFVHGTMASLGLEYEALKKVNPRIILLSISGFGQTGPLSGQRAFGRTAEAFGGMAYITGFPDRPPMHSGLPLADYIGGVFGALSVMSAVYERDHGSGEGQHIDLGLYEATFRLLEYLPATYQQLGVVTERMGSANAYVAPVGTYRTADDSWASFTGSTQDMVRRLFRAIGRPELIDDARFCDATSRVANRDELDEIIVAWMADHTLAEVRRVFAENDVAIAPILSVADMFEEPQYQVRGDIQLVEDADLGSVALPAVIPFFSRTPGSIRHAGPGLDADRQRIMSEWLGRDTAPADEQPLSPVGESPQ
jgi:crotonobetainyl-CoA:carnitine CoA-transferase CaiB-like acyl-CoA transferase